jgi:hypothetical protein
MKVHGLCALAILFSGCRAGGPEAPGTAQATITLTVADGVTPEEPLRFAVAWRQGTGTTQHWITTYDVPVGLSEGTLTVPLDLPPEAERAALADLAEVRVECGADSSSSYWPVAIPRLVLYQDVDGSGSLNADLPYSSGVDRVWAVGAIGSVPSEIVAFLDLDETLSMGGLEMSECVRELTQGLYVPFLMGQGYPSYVEPTGATLSATLELSPTDYPRVAMGCEDSSASALSQSVGSLSLGSREATVDTEILDDLCATTTLPCDVDDLESPTAPDLAITSYPGFVEMTRCAVQGSFDILWHREVTLECEDCSCIRVETGHLWIADESALPSWWPCGDSVDYCAGQQPSIWSPPSPCTLVEARPE